LTPEPEIQRLRAALEEKEVRVAVLEAELREIHRSLGWQLLMAYARAKDRWLPPGGKRRARYESVIRALKLWWNCGVRGFLREISARVCTKGRPAGRPPVIRTDSMVRRSEGRWGGRVLIVGGSDGYVQRYRCDHTREQLYLQGVACDVYHLSSPALAHIAPDYDLVILHRVCYSEDIEDIVGAARARHAPVLFDIDDLVFDPDVLESIDGLQAMGPLQQAVFKDSVWRHRRTLERCDAALVTTETLAEAVDKMRKPAWVHRNALSLDLIRLSEQARRTRDRADDKVIVGYASGSRTHNRDFAEAETALERIVQAYPRVELWLIGHLDLKEQWARYETRIRRFPFVTWRKLPEWLAQLDVNLAPLEAGNRFCQAKSELKYIEAAAVGVPTIASRTGAFEFAIRDGDNGRLADHPEAWFKALDELVTHPTLRLEMAGRALADVFQRYHPEIRGKKLVQTLGEIAESVREAWTAP
jgi:glycosyltransferase involved in cell wall biosynthesis